MARPTDEPKTARIDLRLPPRVIEVVDEWRRHETDIPARAEAIRRLVEKGIVYQDLEEIARGAMDILAELRKRGALSHEESRRYEQLFGQDFDAFLKRLSDAKLKLSAGNDG